MAENYFNSLSLRRKIKELSKCRFMDPAEFNGVEALKGKKIVIVGCGAQGLNQGLNLRASGLDV
jgi:ketol-acid reductoisomerase